jgi:antagonist of KipI
MEMTILKPGWSTSVQDLGRLGHRNEGVPLSGAMDPVALRIANLLVGNPETSAALEVTLSGAELSFSQGAVVAVCGAEYSGIPAWRPFVLQPGEILKLGDCTRGYRGYIAVRGGLDVPLVLGSRSTYLPGGWGGWAGRKLEAGDQLPIGAARPLTAPVPGISASWSLLPSYAAEPILRVILGAQAAWFGASLGAATYKVSPQSDRMGLRLGGPKLTAKGGKELVSSGVVPGTVQVPPDGQPIVLGADAQTIGGYPRAAQVVAVDLPVVAQLRPGDVVKFRPITLAEAQWLLLQREQHLALLSGGLKTRWDHATA